MVSIGLGFNIRGGIDSSYLEGDPGIFVVKIREQGAAADDGRMQEGDKLLEVLAVFTFIKTFYSTFKLKIGPCEYVTFRFEPMAC